MYCFVNLSLQTLGCGWSLPKNTGGGGIIHNAGGNGINNLANSEDLSVTTNYRRIFRGSGTSTKRNKPDKGWNEIVGFREFKDGCWATLGIQ